MNMQNKGIMEVQLTEFDYQYLQMISDTASKSSESADVQRIADDLL